MTEQLDILKGQCTLLEKRVKITMQKLSHAKNLVNMLEQKLWREKYEFESCDRQLAMIDGRYQVLPAAGTRAIKKPIEVSLTKEQVQAIADKLGVSISFEPNNDEEELEEEEND